MSEGGYIQGAGDDSEGWAYGLTPPIFWANESVLFKTDEEDLPSVIQELVAEDKLRQNVDKQATLVSPTKNLYLSQTDPGLNDGGRYDLVIDCNGSPDAVQDNPNRLNLGCGHSKLGSRDLRKHLDKVTEFVGSQLAADPSRSLLMTCESGKDLSPAALLAVVCLFYDENGGFGFTPQITAFPANVGYRSVYWITCKASDGQTIHSTAFGLDRVIKTRCKSFAVYSPVRECLFDVMRI